MYLCICVSDFRSLLQNNSGAWCLICPIRISCWETGHPSSNVQNFLFECSNVWIQTGQAQGVSRHRHPLWGTRRFVFEIYDVYIIYIQIGIFWMLGKKWGKKQLFICDMLSKMIDYRKEGMLRWLITVVSWGLCFRCTIMFCICYVCLYHMKLLMLRLPINWFSCKTGPTRQASGHARYQHGSTGKSKIQKWHSLAWVWIFKHGTVWVIKPA
jgi:hypothetical protein